MQFPVPAFFSWSLSTDWLGNQWTHPTPAPRKSEKTEETRHRWHNSRERWKAELQSKHAAPRGLALHSVPNVTTGMAGCVCESLPCVKDCAELFLQQSCESDSFILILEARKLRFSSLVETNTNWKGPKYLLRSSYVRYDRGKV